MTRRVPIPRVWSVVLALAAATIVDTAGLVVPLVSEAGSTNVFLPLVSNGVLNPIPPSVYPSGAVGYDLSFPECSTYSTTPPVASNGRPYAFAIVGVGDGK